MRQSLMSITFAAVLLFKCYVLSGALPLTMAEDGSLEQETFSLETGLGDADLGHEGGRARGPRVFVVGDPSLWRELRMLNGGLPLFKRKVDTEGQKDVNIPILRRDNMRCMVGRVYRPCWEV